MKRSICVFFSWLLLFNLIPVSVCASSAYNVAEHDELSATEVRSIVDSTFPEYSQSHHTAFAPVYSISTRSSDSSSIPHLVFEETRAVCDDMDVTYLEYSNGRSFAYLRHTTSLVSSSTNTGAMTRTVNIYITCYGSSAQVTIKNFQYVLVGNGYDVITSRGSIENSLSDSPALFGSYQLQETAGSNAYAKYSCLFVSYLEGGYEGGIYRTVTGTVTVNVGDDSMYVDISEFVS